MERQEKEIICKECGTLFLWTEGEQEYYEANNLIEPKRCKDCRKARKVNRNQRDN